MVEKSIDAIYAKQEDIIGWLKKIDSKLQIQNGRVQKNEQNIALLQQRHEIEGKFAERVEKWSRKKLLFYGAGALILLQVIIEIIKTKLMG